MKKTNNLYLCIIILLSSSQAIALTSEEAMIQGFVKWQASRIEKIILDEAIDDITKDPYVERFFTNTADNIKLYSDTSSKRLVPIMQFYIKSDINNFKSVVETCIPYNINSWFDDSIDINKRSKNAKSLYTGLKALASNANEMPRFTVTDFFKNVCAQADLTKKITINIKGKKISVITKKMIANLNTNNDIKVLEPLPDNINSFLSHAYLSKLVNSIERYQKVFKNEKKYTIKAHQMLLLIEQFGGISQNDYTGFNKLKNATIFFSGLADASDTKEPDAVVAVLNSYIDDKDTYMRKRIDKSYYSVVDVQVFNQETKTIKSTTFTSSCTTYFILPCSDTIFVSSYYGVSYANTSENIGEDKKWNFRAFGPVGIEIKLATFKSSPFTINFAPIDIGNYLTIELKGNDYSAKFEDILAPSIFFAYSLKSKPITFLAGYQRGIKIADNIETQGPFISIVFDLPIFTLY